MREDFVVFKLASGVCEPVRLLLAGDMKASILLCVPLYFPPLHFFAIKLFFNAKNAKRNHAKRAKKKYYYSACS